MKASKLNEYKSSLNSALSRDLSEFEKNFILISGAILAFSITFIKEIVKIEHAQNLWLLYTSWAFIIISIGLMMFAFLKSAKDCDKLWKVTDDFIIANKLYDDEADLTINQADLIKNQINTPFYESKSQLKIFRNIAVSSFIIGIIFLSLFTAINLSHENKSTIDKTENSQKNESIIVEHNNQTVKLILNHGKDSTFIEFKTVSDSKTNSTESVTTTSTTNTTNTTKTDPTKK